MNHWRLVTISSGRSPFSKNLTAWVIGRGSPTRSPLSFSSSTIFVRAFAAERFASRSEADCARAAASAFPPARLVGRFPAVGAERDRSQRPVELDDRAYRQLQFAPPDHVGHVAECTDH